MALKDKNRTKLDLEDIVKRVIVGLIVAAICGFIAFFITNELLVSAAALIVALALYLATSKVQRLRHLLSVVGWLIVRNWQILVGLLLLGAVSYGAFVVMKTPWAAILVVALAFAITLLTRNYPQLPPRRRIALKTAHGKYLRALDGGRSVIDGRGHAIDRWETFELGNIGFGKVTLRTWHGQYVRVDKETALLVAPSRKWSPYAVFKKEDLGANKIALLGLNDRYVSAEPEEAGYRVIVDREPRQEWETFTMEHVPRRK